MTVVQNLPSDLQNLDPGPRLSDAKGLSDAISGRNGASTENAITASTTSTQAAAFQLRAAFNVVTVSGGGGTDAIKLPVAVPGTEVVIVNTSGNIIFLFPFLGDAINAAGANNSVSIANVTTSKYYCGIRGQWWGGATTNET